MNAPLFYIDRTPAAMEEAETKPNRKIKKKDKKKKKAAAERTGSNNENPLPLLSVPVPASTSISNRKQKNGDKYTTTNNKDIIDIQDKGTNKELTKERVGDSESKEIKKNSKKRKVGEAKEVVAEKMSADGGEERGAKKRKKTRKRNKEAAPNAAHDLEGPSETTTTTTKSASAENNNKSIQVDKVANAQDKDGGAKKNKKDDRNNNKKKKRGAGDQNMIGREKPTGNNNNKKRPKKKEEDKDNNNKGGEKEEERTSEEIEAARVARVAKNKLKTKPLSAKRKAKMEEERMRLDAQLRADGAGVLWKMYREWAGDKLTEEECERERWTDDFVQTVVEDGEESGAAIKRKLAASEEMGEERSKNNNSIVPGVHTLVLAHSNLRAVELAPRLYDGVPIGKLIKKVKTEEQRGWLKRAQKKYKAHKIMAVGTAKRTHTLCDADALTLKFTRNIVIDCKRDPGSRNHALEMKQQRHDIFHLIHTHFRPHLLDNNNNNSTTKKKIYHKNNIILLLPPLKAEQVVKT